MHHNVGTDKSFSRDSYSLHLHSSLRLIVTLIFAADAFVDVDNPELDNSLFALAFVASDIHDVFVRPVANVSFVPLLSPPLDDHGSVWLVGKVVDGAILAVEEDQKPDRHGWKWGLNRLRLSFPYY